MGERSIVAIAEALDSGLPVSSLTFIPGTVYKTGELPAATEVALLPSWNEVCSIRKPTEKVFVSNTKIPISSLEKYWRRITVPADTLCRILPHRL